MTNQPTHIPRPATSSLKTVVFPDSNARNTAVGLIGNNPPTCSEILTLLSEIASLNTSEDGIHIKDAVDRLKASSRTIQDLFAEGMIAFAAEGKPITADIVTILSLQAHHFGSDARSCAD